MTHPPPGPQWLLLKTDPWFEVLQPRENFSFPLATPFPQARGHIQSRGIPYKHASVGHTRYGFPSTSCMRLSRQNTGPGVKRPRFFSYKFIYFNYRPITLQYCIGFAIHQHESTTGIHVFPILNPPPTSLPIPPLWGIPVHQPRASCILHLTWTGVSFHIWYYTCFNVILPNHPTLALSHRVQNTVLYICVSFAISHTGLSLPSF